MAKHTSRLVAIRRGDVPVSKPAAEVPIDPVFLTQTEAARRMGLGVKTLQALVAAGRIFVIPVGTSGKYVKVPIAEVEKWRLGTYGQPVGEGARRSQ